MMLRAIRRDGTTLDLELGDKPITIGRGAEADLVIVDEKASRLHCGVRLLDGDYYLRDLKSKNGTRVNGEVVDAARLKAGDRIRIGSTMIFFEEHAPAGAETVIQDVGQQMADGKGYSTILKEIVGDLKEPPPAEARPPSRPSRRPPSSSA